ncbi:MAG: twin-arginine translocation signal domain-containing protein, partial [Verrucomicrobiota bacterium]
MRNQPTRRRFLATAAASAAAVPLASLAEKDTDSDWRPLFDGKTLNGWKRVQRISVRAALDKASTREAVDAGIEEILAWHRSQDSPAYRHVGKWEVVDGAIEGGQDPPGSRLGAYL